MAERTKWRLKKGCGGHRWAKPTRGRGESEIVIARAGDVVQFEGGPPAAFADKFEPADDQARRQQAANEAQERARAAEAKAAAAERAKAAEDDSSDSEQSPTPGAAPTAHPGP